MNGSLNNSSGGALNPAVLPSRTVGRLKFQILNAFSTDVFGGNPAAIVFLDRMLPNEILEKINDNFNQPIVVYVSSPQSDTPPKSGGAVFGLRWFGPRNEMRICGHGTRMLCISFLLLYIH
jgi:PhzF family phenazine biosynthesis protein